MQYFAFLKKCLHLPHLKITIMKKILTAILIVAGMYTAASAQTRNSSEFGVNVGYNASTVATDYYTNTSYRSGFNFGISEDYYFSDAWSFKIKAIYDQKGWSDGYLSDANDNSYYTNYKLNYITVPLMANWHFGRTRNWYLNFGPYVGFLLNAKETTGHADLSQAFNKVDGGLDLGIGIKFPVSNSANFFIELDGQGSVSDIIKNNTDEALRNDRSSINFGFSFPLK
jgi:outer membrane protein W